MELSELFAQTGEPGLKEFQFKAFLPDNSFFNLNNSIVIDTETYNLNSQVRLIQILDIASKTINLFLHGRVTQDTEINLSTELRNDGYNLIINQFETESEIIEQFFNYIKQVQKPIIGHNVAHFDLGILNAKKKQYDIKGVQFHAYKIGIGYMEKYLYFAYEMPKKDAEADDLLSILSDVINGDVDNDIFKSRIPIVDTLYLLKTIGMPASLKEAAKNNKYQKQEVDFRVFENEYLSYDALKYSIGDILAIPEVYQSIRQIIEPVSKYLSVQTKASQLLIEHPWEKGAGALADSYLNKTIGELSINCPQHACKYLGGLTRNWINTKIFKATDTHKIHELDFTSAYVFSIGYQNIMDILKGEVKQYSEIRNIDEIEIVYPQLIYSAVLEINFKVPWKVLIEVERDKNDIRPRKKQEIEFDDSDYLKNGRNWGIAFARSFDGDDKISDLEHDFAFVAGRRGQKLILTKTEYEMNKAFNPDFEDAVNIIQIIDGLAPLNDKVTREYLELFKIRKQLKDAKNPAQEGIKRLILSVYGKLAQATGQFFNKACAAAITGFARYQLFSTILYAQSKNIPVIQSDTDSLYCYCNEAETKLIQDYASKINPLTQEYGSENLKHENFFEIMWGQKRKRYVKIKKVENGVEVKVTGENGSKDIRWQDILFRLCSIFNPENDNGDYDLKILKEKINSLDANEKPTIDFKKYEIFCKMIYSQYQNQKLSSILPVKSPAEITNKVSFHAGKTLTYKGKVQDRFIEAWSDKVKANILLKLKDKPEYKDLIETYYNIESLEQQIININNEILQFDKDVKKSQELLKSPWYNFFLLLDRHIGVNYGEDIFDSEDHKKYRYYFQRLSKAIKIPYENSSNYYLHLFEYFKAEGIDRDVLIKLINHISPIQYEIDLSVFNLKTIEEQKEYNIDSIEVIKVEIDSLKTKEYLDAIKRLKVLNIVPYIGMFFEVNRDYSFEDKKPDEIDFSINYEAYRIKPDYSPVISVTEYQQLVRHEINIDTIFLKAQSSLSMSFIKDDSDKKKISNALYKLGHSARVPKNGFYFPVFKINAELSDEVNPETGLFDISITTGKEAKKLSKEAGKKSMYHDAEIYVQAINHLDFGVQINKVGMFVLNKDIFALYRFFDQIDRSIRAKLTSMLEEQGIKISIPRLNICAQVDVSQETTRGLFEQIHALAIDTRFNNKKINDFYLITLTNYVSIACYDKHASATNKIKSQLLSERQRYYFISEADQDYRAELKFELKRNIDTTISFAYLLSLIDQESLIKFMALNGKFTQKRPTVKLTAKTTGHFEFSDKKCLILFSSIMLIKTSILLTQGMDDKVSQEEDELLKFFLAVLDGHGVSTAKPPPLIEELSKKDNEKWSGIRIFPAEGRTDVIWRISPSCMIEFETDLDKLRGAVIV